MERTGEVTREGIKLVCDHVGKTFVSRRDSFECIRDITLEVRENEFLVLFGPGQCGKTTMLNIVAGLDRATAGTVYHNGKAVESPDASRGMVYQTLAMFPWLTVMGNVAFGPKTRGLKKAEYQARAQHYIDLVGLTGFESSYPNQLSGGMKQRVGIARAYCNDADILLMDEPFGHLDAQTRYMMQEELSKIWLRERRTVLFVTNNLEEAIFLADRIILLSDCPTTIRREYEIGLPRPRDLTAPAFLEIREEIAAAMDVTDLMGGVEPV